MKENEDPVRKDGPKISCLDSAREKILLFRVWWSLAANKPAVYGIVMFHIASLLVFIPYFFSWSGLIICLVTFVMTAWIGIGVGFHRLLTHRSFKTYGWVKYTLTFLGQLALEGSPLRWVNDHRKHHQYSDQLGDPHSPNDGFNWSHIFWMFYRPTGESIGLPMVGDLKKEWFMRFMTDFFWLPQAAFCLVVLVLSFFFGGIQLALSWFVWAVVFRTVLTWNVTWAINSIGHTLGYRSFDTGDDSTNSILLGVISGGEGFHNTHHAFPSSAAHGLRWFEFDFAYRFIRALELFGLAWNVKVPQKVDLDSKRLP